MLESVDVNSICCMQNQNPVMLLFKHGDAKNRLMMPLEQLRRGSKGIIRRARYYVQLQAKMRTKQPMATDIQRKIEIESING